MCLLCIMWSLCVVTLAPLYNSSPEESLCIPVEFFAIEGAGIEVLIVVKVVVIIMKLNCQRPGCSKAVVGWAVCGSNAIVHLQLPGLCHMGGCYRVLGKRLHRNNS